MRWFNAKLRVMGYPPEVKRIVGIPPGAKARVRFRWNDLAKVFVRLNGSTVMGELEWNRDWDYWLFVPVAENRTL